MVEIASKLLLFSNSHFFFVHPTGYRFTSRREQDSGQPHVSIHNFRHSRPSRICTHIQHKSAESGVRRCTHNETETTSGRFSVHARFVAEESEH